MKSDESVEALGLMLAISDLRMEVVSRCINAAEEWHARVYTRDKGARQSLMAAVAEAGERGLANFDLKQTAYATFFQERARADREGKTDLSGCAISASGQVVPAPALDGRFDRLTRALDDLVRAGGSAEAVVGEMRILLALPGMGGWISVKDRYPENGQEVIFVVEAGDEDYAGSVQKGHYHRYQFSDGWIDHEFSFPSRGTRASFWMPAPEPPNMPSEGKESV
jgi:hypothetical protein